MQKKIKVIFGEMGSQGYADLVSEVISKDANLTVCPLTGDYLMVITYQGQFHCAMQWTEPEEVLDTLHPRISRTSSVSLRYAVDGT